MQHLLRAPASRARNDLALAQAAIAAAFPLKAAHRKALPFSVQELSSLLTAERAQLQGYWQKPSLTGAYLYYFLPWNLLRLAWLLPGLPLDLQENGRVLDLGSGPLTLPLGLWLSRPELRKLSVSITCADPAQRPMELGRSVFERLQTKEESGQMSGWELQLLRAPIEVALRKAGKVNLITAGNVLNEISPRQERLEERLEEIFYSMDRALEPGGQIFLLEPGTRLGGKLVSLMRRIALAEGYSVEAPCTHAESCPYAPLENSDDDDEAPAPRQSRDKAAPRQASGWCHFNLTSDGAPQELLALSQAAELEKERLSFACLLLRKPGGKKTATAMEPDKTTHGGLLTPVRIISDPIKLPQSGTRARYVCSRHGLGLLHQADYCKSGMLVEALLPDKATRDAKSGAWNMQVAQPEKWQPSGQRPSGRKPSEQQTSGEKPAYVAKPSVRKKSEINADYQADGPGRQKPRGQQSGKPPRPAKTPHPAKTGQSRNGEDSRPDEKRPHGENKPHGKKRHSSEKPPQAEKGPRPGTRSPRSEKAPPSGSHPRDERRTAADKSQEPGKRPASNKSRSGTKPGAGKTKRRPSGGSAAKARPPE